MTFRVKLCSATAKAPTRGSRFAAGHDLYASESGVIPGRGQGIIKTGISVALPEGTYGRVAPRSGLAAKNGINTGAGVIDSDYRGEIGVILFNHKDEDFRVSVGDRVAQLIVEQIRMDEIVVVDSLDETERAAGGFGSTGTN